MRLKLSEHVMMRVRVQVLGPGVVGHRPRGEVAGVTVEIDTHRMAGVGHLAVGGQQRVFDRRQERARLDPLLLLDELDALQNFLAHERPPQESNTNRPRRMAE